MIRHNITGGVFWGRECFEAPRVDCFGAGGRSFGTGECFEAPTPVSRCEPSRPTYQLIGR